MDWADNMLWLSLEMAEPALIQLGDTIIVYVLVFIAHISHYCAYWKDKTLPCCAIGWQYRKKEAILADEKVLQTFTNHL